MDKKEFFFYGDKIASSAFGLPRNDKLDETTKDLNRIRTQVIMFYNLKGEKLCQNI
ncbi:hypothetical protein OMAG_002605 [Candidatus Omnitrophus magneticus]|uniref:Uncharacterized protein n=1 Tax=Candidatus Omnitrophus magneticus TaxID=1609969 RepID=A0A0F0CJL6_9BACT|nr:hypothetical protein OMAG_002605 [Candidatus Omnitrophus magneticus]